MKLAELMEGKYVVEGISHVVSRIVGSDGEIASLVLEDVAERRHVLVATGLGVVECTLDMSGPFPAERSGHPINASLVRWDDWPRLSIAAATYPSSRDDFYSDWTITGWPKGTEPGKMVDEKALGAAVASSVKLGT